MHISDVNDCSPEPIPAAEEFIAKGRKKQIKSVIEELVNDEFDRLGEYADTYLSGEAADRAERFLERVLEGDDDAAMALLGSASGGDRHKILGCDEGEPWASLIHGRLFETGGIKLRRQIVEAHPELLKSERIADLESIVEGLSNQVRNLERDLAECRDRL